MKLKDIFPLFSKNQPIKIVTGKDVILYHDVYEIPPDMTDRNLLHIAHDKDGIILYVEKIWYGYDKLDTKSKINALYTFMHSICDYDMIPDNDDITKIEYILIDFWLDSGYKLDIEGNWYDEKGEKIG